ncbi:MAG: DUF1549 domain-containing protein [Planctomycetaceae bacterium]|jgi:hypothetical protein|nr:DUF1549 domain-containing protein [Planctomycetaceae bacterium]
MSRTLALFVCLALCCSANDGLAQKKKASRKPVTLRGKNAKRSKKKSATKSQKLPALKTVADKQKFLEVIRESMPTRRVSTKIRYLPADLDNSLEYRVGRDSDFAPLIDDERFVRRVHLDLVGRPPSVKVIRDFVADETGSKRAALVNRLMKTEQFARKWARYWKNVIFHESTAPRSRTNPQALENWLTEQFRKGTSWDRIVAELVSAMPVRNKKKKKEKNAWSQKTGQNNFVLAYENKPPLLASQTARLFMGISIQCAECHDHPFDDWKREQFHELAAFFSKGKYYMPGMGNADKKTEMKPRFLLGEQPTVKLTSHQRRVAVAAYLVYNQDNYWFARSFVNRIWNELVGDGFYAVDSLGPDQECLHPSVVNRIAAVFRYRDFDPRWVFRLLTNSRAYQREIRTIEKDEELFTAVRPIRLNADQVKASVLRLTGPDRTIGRDLDREFRADPSLPQRDREGSVQQSLLLMNNATLHRKLNNGRLKKQLVMVKAPRALLNRLYLAVLSRRPTSREISRGLDHLMTVKNRAEAVEDLLWVLVNSTEFLTKR